MPEWKSKCSRSAIPETASPPGDGRFENSDTKRSAIHFPEHDVHAAENDHRIRDELPKAQVFQHSQVDETRRAHAISVRIRPAVADQVKSQFTLWSFDATVSLARLRTEAAQLRLRVNDRPFGNSG